MTERKLIQKIIQINRINPLPFIFMNTEVTKETDVFIRKAHQQDSRKLNKLRKSVHSVVFVFTIIYARLMWY